jgi:hypothetical protein
MQLSKYTCIEMFILQNLNLYKKKWYYILGAVNDSNAVFKIHKKGLRLIIGVNNRVSCRHLFGDFKILTESSLYIFVILCFIKKKKIYITQYSDIHKYNTKGKQELHVQLCNTACCKKKG